MTLNEYQKQAMTTCMPSSENFSYMFLNLVGEVGEFASKVAKAIRKDKMQVGGDYTYEINQLRDTYGADEDEIGSIYDGLEKEAGDILWQLSGLCTVMGWSLEDVGQTNLDKLQARKQAGTIVGNGDGIIREK